MSAIRVARGFTGRDDIIKFEGCYHGHSDSLLVQAGSGMATFGTPSSPGVPADLTKHTILCQYNSIDSVKKAFENSSNISCVIIEPIAGNMGLIPANVEFLKELRELCTQNGALLIFDEVMSGFRASLRGASGLVGVEADMITFGKVIGGGMPVGAFGARAEIMDRLSPDGDIYQAGTLSGNPVAMAAGYRAIKKLKQDKEIYDRLEAKATRLMSALQEVAMMNNIAITTDVRGSMFGFFFNDITSKNFDDALKSNTDRFAKFHSEMLKRGFYFACSQFEAGFISDAMSDDDIDDCIRAFNQVMGLL
jgi:glutamate-1-semialdehyde 2,1-aminomutase